MARSAVEPGGIGASRQPPPRAASQGPGPLDNWPVGLAATLGRFIWPVYMADAPSAVETRPRRHITLGRKPRQFLIAAALLGWTPPFRAEAAPPDLGAPDFRRLDLSCRGGLRSRTPFLTCRQPCSSSAC